MFDRSCVCETLILPAIYAALAVSLVLPASAQSTSGSGRITGQVIADQSFMPVPAAILSLSGTGAQVRTNSMGRFEFRMVSTGQHELVIRALGFQEFRHTISVSAGETLDLEAVLTPAVATLDSVVTSASAPARINIFMADFESRRKAGFGRFLTEGELAAQPGRTLDALLRNSMPGLRMFSEGSKVIAGSTRGLASTTGLTPGRAGTSGRCYLQVIVDDVVAYDKSSVLPLFDLRSVDVSFLAGVEYYTPSQTPAEFNRGSSAPCGTLVIWRKN